ncbi:MAG: AraC family transcriptional regulator [Opitutae bacterium]|nr:AraC family transcriptional regulator [Opitutae bacterium]
MFDPRARRPIAVQFPACGVFVLESHHARGFRMEPARHPFMKIVQPFSGAGWLVRGGARVPLRGGGVVLVPAGERHHIEDDGLRPLSLYALCLAPRSFSSLPTSLARFRHFPAPAWNGELRGIVRHLLHEQTLARVGAELLITGFAWQALGLVARAAAGRAPEPRHAAADQPARARVAAYAAELARRFYDRQSVDSAAATLGLSRRHFTQLFREATGESWLAVIQRHRLEHAKRLLRETNRSVTSIAYECGFDEITTFYRAFKAAERTSPLAWRNAAAARTRS